MNILGILIDNITKIEALQKIEQFLFDSKQHHIATPNPEMVMAAQKDKEFLEILNRADLAVPDGIGLILASRYLKQPLSQRITGVDLMLDICKIAEQKNYSIYLLGGENGVAKKAANELQKKFPKLKIAGAESGGKIEISNFIQTSNLIKKINFARPEILFVAFGAGKQEKWIAHNLINLSSVKIAMGVGGAFDFIAGKVKRAPPWVRNLGFEWLWRFFLQPWRWKRIINATVKFSWACFKAHQKIR